MKDRKTHYAVLFITLGALCVFAAVLIHALWYSPDAEVPLPKDLQTAYTTNSNVPENPSEAASVSATQTSQPEPESLSVDLPKTLTIPTLGINAKVQDVGINSKGNMSVPSNFTDVGWYKYGTLPGDMGSAVIAGHVDDGLALPGVFINLGNLKKGDDIYVEMTNGTKLHFVVTTLSTYDYNAIVPSVFEKNDNRYLNLITCAGVWVEANKTHNMRLVVTAVES